MIHFSVFMCRDGHVKEDTSMYCNDGSCYDNLVKTVIFEIDEKKLGNLLWYGNPGTDGHNYPIRILDFEAGKIPEGFVAPDGRWDIEWKSKHEGEFYAWQDIMEYVQLRYRDAERLVKPKEQIAAENEDDSDEDDEEEFEEDSWDPYDDGWDDSDLIIG